MERRKFEKNYDGLFGNAGNNEPICATYNKFVNDFNWLHIVSTLANHRFLEMDKVLDQPIEDVFTYISYLQSKIVAEKAQEEFLRKINDARNKRRR